MKNSKKAAKLLIAAAILTFLTGCSEPVSEEIPAWKDAGFKITQVTSPVSEALDLSQLTEKDFAHTGSAILADDYSEGALVCMNELVQQGGIYLDDYMYAESTINEYSFYQVIVFAWGFVEVSQLSVSDTMSIDYYEMKSEEVNAECMAETLIYDEVLIAEDGKTGF